ncbi:hypothetical protein RQP46_006158 [Phenoliferia psychrophenolica]
MAPPQLPPELVTDIIELTVELLVEEERHLEAHEPLSNQFLRSAALVDRTWNAIATPVLLNSGTVTSGSVVCFLEQVKAHGIEDTLERVRFGEASGGVTEQDAAAEDTAFDLLVGSLSGLIKIELVNSGSYFQTALPQGRAIRQVHLTNVEVLEGGFGRKFGHTPPSRIIITNTHPLWPRETLDITDSTFTLVQLFCEVENFTITSNQVSISLYITILGLISRLAQASRLRSCHFECTVKLLELVQAAPTLENLKSSTMAPPQLPPELIADILDITVELLIEEERHLEAHAPLSNRFLLSAALVDCTWNAIATQLLLKRGIVTSGSVPGYLEQVKVHGMGATLRSVRWGEASGGVAAAHAANEDVAFDLLVGTLSGLMDIELVDAGAFRTALPAGHGALHP